MEDTWKPGLNVSSHLLKEDYLLFQGKVNESRYSIPESREDL